MADNTTPNKPQTAAAPTAAAQAAPNKPIDISKFSGKGGALFNVYRLLSNIRKILLTDDENKFQEYKKYIVDAEKYGKKDNVVNDFLVFKRTTDFNGINMNDYDRQFQELTLLFTTAEKLDDIKTYTKLSTLKDFFLKFKKEELDNVLYDYYTLIQSIDYILNKKEFDKFDFFKKYLNIVKDVKYADINVELVFKKVYLLLNTATDAQSEPTAAETIVFDPKLLDISTKLAPYELQMKQLISVFNNINQMVVPLTANDAKANKGLRDLIVKSVNFFFDDKLQDFITNNVVLTEYKDAIKNLTAFFSEFKSNDFVNFEKAVIDYMHSLGKTLKPEEVFKIFKSTALPTLIKQLNIVIKDTTVLTTSIDLFKKYSDYKKSLGKPNANKEETMNLYKKDIDAIKAIQQPIIKSITDIKADIAKLEGSATTEGLTWGLTGGINEGIFSPGSGGKKIPGSIEDVIDQADLEKASQIPKIKELTFHKLNTKRLETIDYEADVILRITESNEGGKKQKYIELEKSYKSGVRAANDLFQKVIDIEKMMKTVEQEKKNLASNTKEDIENNAKNTDKANLEKLGITDVLEQSNVKLLNKNLYFLSMDVKGYNKKVGGQQFMLVSPTKEYIEDTDDKTFFWFKLFGFYKWDNKTNAIVKINNTYFQNLSLNNKLKSDLTDDNEVYVAFDSIRANTINNNWKSMFIYSKNGYSYYNNKLVTDVTTIQKEIKSSVSDKNAESLKNYLATSANYFGQKVAARFAVDMDKFIDNKYPGVKIADITNDKGLDLAKENHKKIINILLK